MLRKMMNMTFTKMRVIKYGMLLRTQYQEGLFCLAFYKKKIFNFWEDYPQNLTKEEKELFDKEKPFWAAAGGNHSRRL